MKPFGVKILQQKFIIKIYSSISIYLFNFIYITLLPIQNPSLAVQLQRVNQKSLSLSMWYFFVRTWNLEPSTLCEISCSYLLALQRWHDLEILIRRKRLNRLSCTVKRCFSHIIIYLNSIFNFL